MKLNARIKEQIARRARRVPALTRAWARYRRQQYERRIDSFLKDRDGRAGRLPSGVVYEATMRCNLHCEFCYVGDLLNIEGEWRQELPLDVLRHAFPDDAGLQVSLTGGEIFMRKDILGVMEVFRDKGYTCGYLTTNGTIISEASARRRWPSWRRPASSSTSACRSTGRASCTTAREAWPARSSGRRPGCGGSRRRRGAAMRPCA